MEARRGLGRGANIVFMCLVVIPTEKNRKVRGDAEWKRGQISQNQRGLFKDRMVIRGTTGRDNNRQGYN